MQKTHILIFPPRHRRLKQHGSSNKNVEVIEVCTVTSRGKGQWLVPKGWRKRKVSDKKPAQIAAFEEAGVIGSVYLEHSDMTLRLVKGTRKRCFKMYVMPAEHEFGSAILPF